MLVNDVTFIDRVTSGKSAVCKLAHRKGYVFRACEKRPMSPVQIGVVADEPLRGKLFSPIICVMSLYGSDENPSASAKAETNRKAAPRLTNKRQAIEYKNTRESLKNKNKKIHQLAVSNQKQKPLLRASTAFIAYREKREFLLRFNPLHSWHRLCVVGRGLAQSRQAAPYRTGGFHAKNFTGDRRSPGPGL